MFCATNSEMARLGFCLYSKQYIICCLLPHYSPMHLGRLCGSPIITTNCIYMDVFPFISRHNHLYFIFIYGNNVFFFKLCTSKTTLVSSSVGYTLVHTFIVFIKNLLVFYTLITPFCYTLPSHVLSSSSS